MVHVHEAGSFHPAFDLGARLWVLAEGDAGAASEIVPIPFRVRGREGAVFGVDAEVVVLEFGESAGLRGLEALAD